MRLSDIKNEQALDTLAEIIEPAAEILADPEVKKIYKSDTPKVKLASYIIKNHKENLIEIMAHLEGKEPEKYTFNLLTLPKMVLELLNDPALGDLFISQAQEKE